MPTTTSMYIMLNNDPINVGAGNIFESFFNTALDTTPGNYDTQNYFTGLVAGMESYNFSSTASINDLALVNFNLYPNPVNSILHINAQEEINEISIYNLLGEEVKRIEPSTLSAEIDLSDLAMGAYFIKAQVGIYTGTYKILKQ